MRKILNSEQTKDVALETISEIASIVKQTLGPGGNPIILQQDGQNPDGTPKDPLVTKDGVTVAEHVQFRSPSKKTIAQAILQVAKNTVNQAGDGTTTAIVLAEAMYKAGYRYIQQGVNGIQLYNELKGVKDEVIEQLSRFRHDVELEDVVDVARISANGDEEVAQRVGEAIRAVGEDGHITLEDGYTKETTLEIIEGAMYKQGWRKFGALGYLMVTDKVRNVAELENPAVLLYAGEIKEMTEIDKLLKTLMGWDDNSQQLTNIIPLMIIAYDFSDDVKNYILQARASAKMPIAAIKAPFDGSPNARTQMLEDLAVLLGGKVLAKGINDLDKITDADLGCAGRVEIGAEETVFYKGQGDKQEIMDRVKDLKKQLEIEAYDFDKENLRLRIGKLTGGVALIRVGGDSELEMHEKKDRIEDALCAAKVAIQEGILPGGGYTLYKISQDMKADSIARTIVKEALQAPIRQIITNVGEEPVEILTLLKAGAYDEIDNFGYDAREKKFTDLMEAGIVDPVKVTKSALENAISIVGLLLTVGGAIVSDVEPKDGMPNPLAGLMG